MRLTRRSLMGTGGLALGVGALPTLAQAAVKPWQAARLVTEAQSKAGEMASRYAQECGWQSGLGARDLSGQLIGDPLAGPMLLVGVSQYAAFVVAQARSRESGRSLVHAVQLNGGEARPLMGEAMLPELEELQERLRLLSARKGSTGSILWAMT